MGYHAAARATVCHFITDRHPDQNWLCSSCWLAVSFNYLRGLLLNLEHSADEFSQVLRFLSCT